MSRLGLGYLAGAAFVLSAAGAVAAYAQTASPAPAGDGHKVREERTVIVRGDDGDQTTIVRRGDGEERRMVLRRGEGHGEGMGDGRVMIMRHGGRDEAEHLRTMLQLKPSQEGALTAYLAAIRPEHGHEHFVEMSDEAKTTPQRLAAMEKHMAEQAAQGHARIEATRKFYDQLEPSQKKVFDELPMLMIGPMGPMMTMGPMKVMVNMARMPPMPPMPPMPAMPPRPPRAPPAPPAPSL